MFCSPWGNIVPDLLPFPNIHITHVVLLCELHIVSVETALDDNANEKKHTRSSKPERQLIDSTGASEGNLYEQMIIQENDSESFDPDSRSANLPVYEEHTTSNKEVRCALSAVQSPATLARGL